MKQTIITCSIATLFATSGLAQTGEASTSQTGAYIRIGAGYAFPHAGDSYLKTQSGSYLSASVDFGKYSFGAGAHLAIAGGYWFSKNIGAEIGVLGGIVPKKFESSYTVPGQSAEAKMYTKLPVYIVPALVLQTGGEKVNVYTRLGLVVNVPGKVIEEYSSSSLKWEREYSLKTGIGFQGALGASLPLGKKASIFGEVNGISMSQYVKKTTLTQRLENGMDVLPGMPVADKITEHSQEITVTYTTSNPDPNKPTQAATYALPFSNVGFSAGVLIRL